MAQTIKLKRSATSGAVPTTASLALGEMAINTYDGKAYIKKDNGTESVVEIGAGTSYSAGTGISLSGTTFSLTDTNAKLNLSGGTLTGGLTISDSAVPTLILHDAGNAGGGGATGRLLFSNTAGTVMGVGYTADDTASSDLIISTNAAGTYGGYLGLDAGALADPSDIILEPKSNVRIVTGNLQIGSTTVIDSSRNLTNIGTISSGVITATGGNSTNWNTAYGWGNHASGGYYAASNPSGYTSNTGTMVETGTTFNGTYNLSFRIGANSYYSHAGMQFTGSTSTLNVNGNITLGGTVDGRNVATDGTKLDGIAAGATANVGDITGVTAGTGLTGGGTSGTPTLAVDSTVIRTTGNQSMSGIKTFTGDTAWSDGNSFYVAGAGGGRVALPAGASYFSSSGTHTGAVKIKLPTASKGKSDMISFEVTIFDYASDESVKLLINAYQYSTVNWNNQSVVTLASQTGKDYIVRFGSDATSHCLWIGETTSVWAHPQVSVSNFMCGFSANAADYVDGWDISYVTAFDTVEDTVTSSLPMAQYAQDADKLDGQEGSYYYAASNPNGYTNNVGDITGVTAGTGLTGGGTSGTPTLNVIGGSGITANANDITVDSTVIRTTGNQVMSGVKSFTTETRFGGTWVDPDAGIGRDAKFGQLGIAVNGGIKNVNGAYSTAGAASVFTTSSGYISLGPQNATWAHIYTDRPNFYFNTNLYVLGSKVWHAGNDGSGSGLDADLLDGQQGSYYAPIASPSFTGTLSLGSFFSVSSTAAVSLTNVLAGSGSVGTPAYSFTGDTNTGLYRPAVDSLSITTAGVERLRVNATGSVTHNGSNVGTKIWGVSNDGSGSGLDADLLDGVQGSSFLRSDADDSFSGNLTTGANNHLTFGPNGTWGSSLRVGGNGRTATGTEMASMVTTDGNLHLDAANSANGIYLNYYAGTNGTLFGNGAGATVARMQSNGQLYKSGGTTNPYWNSTNDGSGSGLDADLLDGQQGSYYYSAGNPPPLTADPTLTLTGDVTGSATFTNLGNATLTAVVNNDSHSHSQVSIPDTRGSQRAPSYYPDQNVSFDFQQNTDTLAGGDQWNVLQTVSPWAVYANTHRQQQLAWTGTGGLKFRYATSETAWAGWQTLWTSANDGSGSGLDADTLDGYQSSYFATQGNLGNYYLASNPNGYTSNVGDITGVTAGTGLTGGGTSGTPTLNVIGGSGITANANDIAVDSTVVRTTGTQTIGGVKTFSSDVTAGGRVYIQGSTTNFLGQGPYASQNLAINMAGALFFYSGTTNIANFSTTSSFFTNQIVADKSAATTTTASATIISRGTVTTTTGYQPQNYHITFQNGGNVTKGSISSSHYATIYTTSSDYRLKEDLQPISYATERVLALNPVNFKWIDGQQRSDGFIAHELQAHLPEAVTGEKDATTEVTETVIAEDGTETEVTTTVPEMQGIDQSKLVPLLVKTIQELEARITALENA